MRNNCHLLAGCYNKYCMRKRFFLIPLFGFICYFSSAVSAYAVENPLAVPNNKIGIHILFDTELSQAAQLVNSNGGDWGYVTIPIQDGDKDVGKWQRFMDEAKKNHVIPIVRLATKSDPANLKNWQKPTPEDIIDFGSFLNKLNWPVKNRYIIVFNEVNRGDEWGGTANPKEYAELLSFAVTVFKSKSPDFFIISAGMDNAAPNQGGMYMNEYTYLQQMNAAVPGIFNQVDGMSSHSYPNPGFSQPPNTTSSMGTGSFNFERQLMQSLSIKSLPIFITETGWADGTVSDDLKTAYYKQAINTIWNDPNIVAITPFLLQANGGAFQKFSFTNNDGSPTKQYQMLHDLPKVGGAPMMPVRVLAAEYHRAGKDMHKNNLKPKVAESTKAFPFLDVIGSWLYLIFGPHKSK